MLKLLGIGVLAAVLAACGASQAPANRGGGDDSADGTAAPGSAAGEPSLRLVTVAKGFEHPVYVATTPSQPRRIFVVEQIGRIRIVERGRVLSTPFLDIQEPDRRPGRAGPPLDGVPPAYASNGSSS